MFKNLLIAWNILQNYLCSVQWVQLVQLVALLTGPQQVLLESQEPPCQYSLLNICRLVEHCERRFWSLDGHNSENIATAWLPLVFQEQWQNVDVFGLQASVRFEQNLVLGSKLAAPRVVAHSQALNKAIQIRKQIILRFLFVYFKILI